MHIWTISLFDPTPYDKVGTLRFIQIAKAGLRHNHTITHFTSTFRHTSKKQRFNENTELEVEPGYKINYIRSKSYDKNISIKRFFAHRDFAQNLINFIEERPKPDIIFISMPPLSSADQITKWARSYNIPVVTDIIDPWPDSFIKDVPQFFKPISKVFITPFNKKLQRILKLSTAVTSISNGYLKWALQQYKGISKTACFYPALDLSEIQAKMEKYRDKEKRDESILRIIYVGSLGSSYDIPAIVEAAEIMDLNHKGKTEFIIAGVGPQSTIVKEYEKKLTNLSYLGWISDEELMRQYYLSDLGLIQHKNNLTQTITYKLFSYLSASLPILNSLQSEMADIIEANEVGMNNPNGDSLTLSQNIESFLHDRNKLKVYKDNALKLTRAEGDSRIVYSKLIELLEEIVSQKSKSSNVYSEIAP